MVYKNKKVSVLADTIYVDDQLVARDVAFTLPEVTWLTADVKLMGNATVPLIGLLDNMEATFTKVGLDIGFSRAVRGQKQNYELRGVQSVLKADGTTETEPFRVYLRAIPNKIPGVSVEPGNPIEGEVGMTVLRYKLTVAGKEIVLIDRMAGIARMYGKDYGKQIEKYL